MVEVRLDAPDGRIDYRVVEANPAFYALTGFPRDILGRWLREAAPALEEHWYETYGRVARTGQAIRFEQASPSLGRFFDVYALRIGSAQDRRVAILFNDISERKRQDAHTQLLMQEVNHRAKNMLGLVQAVARQTVAGDPASFVRRFTDRIQALAASQDLLVKSRWKHVPLESLVRSQLGYFSDAIGKRIHLSGPALEVTAAAAQAIGLALHELATNAAKHGALSNETGSVAVAWDLCSRDEAEEVFVISWTESGGPPVESPTRRGFGSTVIGGMVKMSVAGEVELDYAPTGLVWRLTCPSDKVLEAPAHPARITGATELPRQRAPAGSRRVLVVEDDALIALEVADILQGAGFEVLGPAASVAQALELLRDGACDAAVLDVNLGRESAAPIAQLLTERGTPFLTVSGYGRAQRPATFGKAPHLDKPLRSELLIRELEVCLDTAA